MHLKSEELGFSINRSNGTDFYIFLHFINPVEIRLNDKLIRTGPNACIIYSPHTPQYYTAETLPLLHNYIHFKINDTSIQKSFPLPLNTVFYTKNQVKITALVEQINISCILEKDNFEKRSDDFQAVVSNHLENLFNILKKEHLQSSYFGQYSQENAFYALRSMIYSEPANWNIHKMLAYTNLSRSRFFLLYKHFFNVTPNDDLINASINLAQSLLSSSNLSLNEISANCGFNSTEYFIRVFTKKKSISPGKFRKSSHM